MALRFVKLFGLLIVAILATYAAPPAVASIFYLLAVFAYMMDKDEPVWLTFFFVLSDGFLGFFNNYDAVVSIIPGLPDVEVGHVYVVATLYKAWRMEGPPPTVFYRSIGLVFLSYVLFLVAQGYAIGVTPELRFHFRIVKYVLPLALFISLPRLMPRWAQFREVFDLFVPFAFLALFAQVFTVATGQAPSQALGARQKLYFTELLDRGQTYRGFYSTGIVLISAFGALFFSAMGASGWRKPVYAAVVIADLLSAFLSATRGWVLAFAVILLLHALFVVRIRAGQVFTAAAIGLVLFFALLRIPAVERQFNDASDRFLTIGLVAEGDLTAGGTLERLDRRAPRVMKKWRDSPLTGQGFSNEYREYGDSHVGNHNLLLHGGIVGVMLMGAFLVFFSVKLIARGSALPATRPLRSGLFVFPIFLSGWFVIHSSSGQQFMFAGEPGITIPQALFFTFGAFCYRNSFHPASNSGDSA